MAGGDPFGNGNFPESLHMPGVDWVPLTPSDSATFPATRGFYIGDISAGATMAAVFVKGNGAIRVIPGLVAGIVYQGRITALKSTSTTVASVFGIY